MFGSGIVKIAHTNSSWRDLSALQYHFLTQPLPGKISPYLHRLPSALLKLMTLSTLIVELPLPIIAILPPARNIGFVGYFIFQLSIMGSGSFGFFNILSMVLGISLLKDKHILRFMPFLYETVENFDNANYLNKNAFHRYSKVYDKTFQIVSWLILPPIIFVYLISSFICLKNLCERIKKSQSDTKTTPLSDYKNMFMIYFDKIYSFSIFFYIGHHYGLFANMTKLRDEIMIEIGSSNKEPSSSIKVDFLYKPGSSVSREPIKSSSLSLSLSLWGFPLPLPLPFHMPRLDWKLWFLALQPVELIKDKKWFLRFLLGILNSDASILGLIKNKQEIQKFLQSNSKELIHVKVSLVNLNYSKIFSSDTWTETNHRSIFDKLTRQELQSIIESKEEAIVVKEKDKERKEANNLIKKFISVVLQAKKDKKK